MIFYIKYICGGSSGRGVNCQSVHACFRIRHHRSRYC